MVVQWASLLLLASLCSSSLATSFSVKNVPYHRQITEFSCGDASLEMVLHWSGLDIDQRPIMDVMRTSASEGTLSYDVVRGAHFSGVSVCPPNGLYPDYAPLFGWNTAREIGLGSFSRRQQSCWLDGLRTTLAAGIPVIVLMHYGPLPEPGDGHFRVAIGYSDASGEEVFTLLDPWDRPNDAGSPPQPRVVQMNASQMCLLWNHIETNGNNLTYAPYFAVASAPWSVAVEYWEDAATSMLFISATVTYVCPDAFLEGAAEFSAYNIAILINLPSSLALSPLDQSSIFFDSLRPQGQITVTWHAASNDTLPKPASPTFIEVVAMGLINGSVPNMYQGNGTWSRGYNYSDRIGGAARVPY